MHAVDGFRPNEIKDLEHISPFRWVEETRLRPVDRDAHTFGHALEAYAGFSDKLLHGEAVAIGICLAFRFAGTDQEDFKRIKAHLDAAGLPTDVRVKNLEPDLDKIMSFIHQDKKSQAGKIRLVLPKALGDVYIEDDVGENELKGSRGPRLSTGPGR